MSFQKALLGNFDINRVPENDMKECEMLCKQLVQAEKLLKKALRGTDVNYSFKDYNILSDMKKIWYGEISFEIGDKTYAEIKRDSHVCGVDLYYRSVSLKEYMDLKEYGINFVSHAAFLKNDMVNLVFLPDQSHLIDLCIGNYKKSQDLEKEKSFEQDNAPKISENDVNKTVRTVLTEER